MGRKLRSGQIKFRDGVLFTPGIAIEEPPKAGQPQPNPKWIHTANEGVFDGYPGGGADITRTTLEEIVKNFKADPRYRAGPNGLGAGRVLPFDVAHISEMDPRVGNPLANETALAWALDVRLQDGPDGKAQLWTYAELGSQILAAIQATPPEINFVSIAFTPAAVHPNTNEPIGALMTSIAFTNKPFIRDLTPLAASQWAAHFLGRYCEPAATPDEAMGGIRTLLNLPLATAPAEVLSHVERIIGWAASGNAPPGVDACEVVEDIRSILNVPLATTIDQILSQIRSIFQSAATQGASQPSVGATTKMDPTLVKLFSLFGLVPAAEGAQEALLKQAGEAVATFGKVNEFLKAAGFADLVDLMGKMPELLKAKQKADEATAKVAELTAKVSGYEAQEQTAEVAAVMSTHKMPELSRGSLLLHLQTDAKTFRTQYPLPDATRKHLLSTFAAGRQGEIEPIIAGHDPVVIGSGGGAKNLPEGAIDLRTFAGENTVQKAIGYLASKDASFAKLDWHSQVKRAGQFCRENDAKIVAL